MKYSPLITFSCCWLIFSSTLGSDRIIVGGLDGLDPQVQAGDRQIKLAISGGGARGLTAVGVLRAFEERNISISAITGTSIGGVIGGLYACGYSADELTELLRNIDFGSLLRNEPARSSMFLTKRQGRERHLLNVRFDGIQPHIPRGYTTGQEVTALLTSLTNRANYLAGGDFSALPIPFKTVGTDIVTGEAILFDSGSLADAMRASIAFPLAFTGIEIGSRVIMDGGMVMPVPVDVARSMGDTTLLVVAINTTSPLLPKEQLVTPVDVAGQVTSIMTADKLRQQLSRADFVINPCPDSFSSTDFKFRDSLMAVGYRCGLQAADSISALLVYRRDTVVFCLDEVAVVSENRSLADRMSISLLGRECTRHQFQDVLKSMVRQHNLLGLSANLEPTDMAESDCAPDGRNLAVIIEPQERWPVSQITIEFVGNHVFDDLTLASRFEFEDSLISVDALRRGIRGIVELYDAEGYDLAGVRHVNFHQVGKRLEIVIDEATVSRIDVERNQRTKDWLVRSYFPLSRGEPYSTRKATVGLENIYSTDLFERVTLDLLPSDSGTILKIGVLEKKYTQIHFGWHWHDEYKSEQFLELLDDNVAGIGMECLLHARTGHDRWYYFGQVRAHRIFSTYFTSLFRFFHFRQNRNIFDGSGTEIGGRREKRSGLLISLGQQIARLGTVTGGLLFEEVRQVDSQTGHKESFGLRSILLQSELETFSRIPFPETGNKHQLEIRIAGKALGGEVEFTRFFSSLETYLPLMQNLNYHPRISIGLSRTGLPPSEQFYIGGQHSFSGFRDNQLSGDKFVLLNQELRLKLPLRLYLFARYDVGEVYHSSDQIKLRNLRHGYGFSIALDSPVGPFEFGYGVADSDTDNLYFNAGYDF